MKILKLIRTPTVSRGDVVFKYHYSALFDELPKLTYEKIGNDYVGSAVDKDGTVIASHFLQKKPYGDAFAGRELILNMKDGTKEKIKDYWYDEGNYKEHGVFVGIGAKTLKEYQEISVFYSYHINYEVFSKMVDEYLSRDRLYTHKEVSEWDRLQHEWHDVYVHGHKIPFQVNKHGDFVEKFSKKAVYPRTNVGKSINGKMKVYNFFKLEFTHGYEDESGKIVKKLIKLEANLLEVLRDSLPCPEEEIIEDCRLHINTREVKEHYRTRTIDGTSDGFGIGD